MLKHLVFPEMLCLCRGTGALRGFSLSNLESDQPSPSPETALSDPFLASPRFLLKGMEPQGRLLPGASHGTGLGIASSPAVLHTRDTKECWCLLTCTETGRWTLFPSLLCPPIGSDELNPLVSSLDKEGINSL